mmetsp:Transcript_1271/g.1714  ORF Transcript_1271/g.1714 Transcript_1271/m.1714 type:complete len:983 (+) Transcript_1271:43-2991(+)
MVSHDVEEHSQLLGGVISDSTDTTEDGLHESSHWLDASQFVVTDQRVDYDQVHRQEEAHIDWQKRVQASDGTTTKVPRGQKFALAFSGGGIRAAAFQAGVLWRLAQMGRLKDVEILTAVSGGGYIAAAYLSHLAHAQKPQPGEDIDDWYRQVVAETIVTMQANQGGFVRDTGKDPDLLGGCWSCIRTRKCDCLFLIVTTIFTMLVNPMLFLVFTVPFVESIEIFFGSAMRAAFCRRSDGEVTDTLFRFSDPWAEWYGYLVATLCFGAFIFFIACRVVKPSPKEKGERYQKVSRCWLFVQAVAAFLNRAAIIGLLEIILINTIVYLMRYSWMLEEAIKGGNKAGLLCAEYSRERGANAAHCAHMVDGQHWYNMDEFKNVTYHGGLEDGGEAYHMGLEVLKYVFRNTVPDVGGILAFIFLFFFVVASICLPILPSLLSVVVAILGPAFIFLFMVDLTKFRVYGSLTEARLFGVFAFNKQQWVWFTTGMSFFALIFIPFYQSLRAVMHNYYRRILRNSYFKDGEDTLVKHFLKETQIEASAYAPFFLFMGTASDFCREGDTSVNASTSEISFSPLHIGSEKTGYISTPEFLLLSKTTALSGAGGMDAIGLGLNDQLVMRFWTETLNLTWGDYILFQPKALKFIRKVAKMSMCRKLLDHKSLVWLILRLPAILVWDIIFVLFALGSLKASHGHGVGEACDWARDLYLWGFGALTLFTFISFLWWLGGFKWVSFSPIMRLAHQISRHYYRGNGPPPMIYVTDGGAYDCTTLTQLVLRRTERIFLVLAAMDPNDELGVLRTAMDDCVARKLCSFYDPEHPKRDIKVYLDRFKEDTSMPHMHIGINYGWSEGKEEAGTLIIVKNRLRQTADASGKTTIHSLHTIEPWLTEEEITGTACEDDASDYSVDYGFDFDREEWDHLKGAEELGGVCCCDSCHHRCNFGKKWPQLTGVNYLWLSPMLFNMLCRLGHSESAVPAEIITGPLKEQFS